MTISGTYIDPVSGLLSLRVDVLPCDIGVYLRWWYNGWHYWLFRNGYEVQMKTESMGTQVTNMFSRISKIERPTKLKAEYSYQVTIDGIPEEYIAGFTGLLLAEKVEQYENSKWYEVEITRKEHTLKEDNSPAYILSFEITRKDRSLTSTLYQKFLSLYICRDDGDVLCDLDEDEVVPVNKQTNDIAEMQDRQGDFTAQFRIRKTRAMRALFELSGEVGASTTLPYEKQVCKLVQEGIEMITKGIMIFDRADEEYYYVSILSGNLNFFKDIETLKLTDLTLTDTEHDWNLTDIEASHTSDLDYVYPLCEPTDNGGAAQLNPGVETVNMYGGWIWPFIKVKAIWDEIFDNPVTGLKWYVSGDILTDDKFLKLFMPITSMKITKAYTDQFLYSSFRRGYMAIAVESIFGTGGTGPMSLILGDALFATGHYTVRFTADYKIIVHVTFLAGTPDVYLRVGSAPPGILFNKTYSDATHSVHEIVYAAIALNDLSVWGEANTYYNITIDIVEINDAKIVYGSPFVPKNHLPDMSQIDFVKMICNMFGLIPDVTPRDKIIRFWNYEELYDNIPLARDWSAYLSEREDETEFKFGDYAQSNYMKYKQSDDVLLDNGKGTMQIDDLTLPLEKDVVGIPVSTCDEIYLDPCMVGVAVSRIAFNKWYDDAGTYVQEEKIDPRIVYVDCIADVTPPVKTFVVRETVAFPGTPVSITCPKKASSLPVSFSSFVRNYAGLSRLLTKTNLRRAKFNLPVYEVAGLKHYIPIYVRQYKAYFYVNKINNFVPGQLCTVDLIKL